MNFRFERLAATPSSGDVHRSGLQLALVGMAVQTILRVGVAAATARLVAPEATGVFQIGFSVAVIALTLSDPGLAETAARQHLLAPSSRSTIMWSNLGLGFLAFGALIALAPYLADLVHEPQSAMVLRALAILPVLSALSASSLIALRRKRRFAALAILDTASAAAGTVASIAVGLAGGGWWALAAYQFAAFAVQTASAFALEPVWPQHMFRWRALRRLANFAAAIWTTRLFVQMSAQVDKLIVGAVLGASALGLFSRASLFVGVPLALIVSASTTTLVPSFAKLRDDRAALSRFFLESSGMLATLTFPAFFGAAALAEPIVKVLLSAGAAWDWSPAAGLLATLAPAAAFDGLMRPHRSLQYAIGKPRAALVLTAFQTALLLSATWLGAEVAGLQGAAFAYAFANVFCFLPSAVIAARDAGTSLQALMAVLAPPGLAALAMWALVQSLVGVCADGGLGAMAQIALLIPIGAALYGALLMLPRLRRAPAR